VRNAVADLLKALADDEDEGSKLVIIGINRAGDSLIRYAPDLNNRIDTIRFEVEPRPKIEELIVKGEEALNVRLAARDHVIEAAAGSFLLLHARAPPRRN
jgi:NADH/NAD ratio-sensing transcriptional regulator Rex